jgi:hypothetical protein
MEPIMKGGKNLILLLALLALLLGAQAPAHACVILEVYEDPYAAPIRDGEIIDINRQANRVAAAGKVEHDWFINLATGNTGPNRVVAGKEHESGHANGRAGFVPFDSAMQFPDEGSAGSNPLLLGKRIRGASTFNFWLYSDNTIIGLSAIPGSSSEPLDSAAFIGSETSSQATSDNTLLGLAASPGSTLVPLESAAYSVGTMVSHETSAPFSFVALESPINQPAGGYVTGFVMEPQAKVPEPMTLILYGLGFAGASLYTHWRRSRN